MRMLVVSLLLALSVGGCVSVAPYEREYLASPAMNPQYESGESGFQSHVFNSREGTTGGSGTGATGGGCGCN